MLEKTDYFKKAIEGNNRKEFEKVIDELEAVSPKDLDEEFKRYLCQKAIEIFDLNFHKNQYGLLDYYEFYSRDKQSRSEVLSYKRSVLKFLNYVSIFCEKSFIESIFQRHITKNLIRYHIEDVIKLIRKNEDKFNNPMSISSTLGFIIKQKKEGKVDLKEEDFIYIKDLFYDKYNNISSKEKCYVLLGNISILKENFKNDEEVINEVKKCICKKRYFYDVVLYEVDLVEAKIKGTDFLIKNFIEKERDEKKNALHKELLKMYLKGSKINFLEFYEKFNLKEFEYVPNTYCKKFSFF